MKLAANRKTRETAHQWLIRHVYHQGEDCLIWPYARLDNGRGTFGFKGKIYKAHRFMCELAHGPAPEGHEAAHSCANGVGGCVNPRHLSWKTRQENAIEAVEFGRYGANRYGNKGKLQPEQVRQIRALRGKHPNTKIGKMFGLSAEAIAKIFRGESYSRVA